MQSTQPGANKFLMIVGPTASGKSHFAHELAKILPGEIVNADSIQIFRGFDIGSAKPNKAQLNEVPYHLIDILNPEEECDAAKFAKLAKAEIAKIQAKGKIAIVVGGSGLYLRALLEDNFTPDLPKCEDLRVRLEKISAEKKYRILQRLDKERATALHPNDHFRIDRALELRVLTGKKFSEHQNKTTRDPRAFVVYLNPEKDKLRQSINERTKQMLSAGLIEETRKIQAEIHEAKIPKALKSVGYLQCLDYLSGKIGNLAELEEKIYFATCQLAKRQRTWFAKSHADLILSESSNAFSTVINALNS